MPMHVLYLIISVLVLKCCCSVNISSTECETKKVCFSHPENCDPGTDMNCYFMSVMPSKDIWEITIEIHGLADGYVSIAFSDDQLMGNDDIYICLLDSNGTIQVQHAFAPGRKRPILLPLGNVSDIKTSVKDQVISCSFKSRNLINPTQISTYNHSYYLQFAYGSSKEGRIQYHGPNQFVSSTRVNIFDPQKITKRKLPNIIKAHGSLMLLAWIMTANIGTMIARSLKAVMAKTWCSKAIWFLAHVFLMSLTVVLTIIGVILVFIHVGGWSGGAHAILGILVVILSLIQPIAAAFRCSPQHQWRFVFNWFHILNAAISKVLAAIAMFTGLLLVSRSDQSLDKVLGGFIAWEILLFLLQEVYKHFRGKGQVDCAVKLMSTEMILLILFFIGNLMFLITILVGISVL